MAKLQCSFIRKEYLRTSKPYFHTRANWNNHQIILFLASVHFDKNVIKCRNGVTNDITCFCSVNICVNTFSKK